MGSPRLLLAHDRVISHPVILLIEHGHFAEGSSESEALRLGSPGGSLTAMYTVRDEICLHRPRTASSVPLGSGGQQHADVRAHYSRSCAHRLLARLRPAQAGDS